MENKLQELTDRLYREGLSKGKEEGEALLAKAEEKAAEIIEDARVKAGEIIKKAEKDAADFRTKVEGDVKMASMQSLQATRSAIENMMVESMVGKQTSSALSSGSSLTMKYFWSYHQPMTTPMIQKIIATSLLLTCAMPLRLITAGTI